MEAEDGDVLGYVSVLESASMQQEADAAADKIKRKASKQVWTLSKLGGGGKHFFLVDFSEACTP